MPSRCAVTCCACQSALRRSLAFAAARNPASRRLRSLGACTCISAIASAGDWGTASAFSLIVGILSMHAPPAPAR